MRNIRDNINTLVREHLNARLTAEDRELINLADFDLWYGPFDNEIEGRPYPGWEAASTRLAAIRDELPSTLYVDLDCGFVGEDEPEGWTEETEDDDGEAIQTWIAPEEYYIVDRSDIVRAVFGKALAGNI